MPASRLTLEQHMATLQQQNPAVTGDHLLRPFPGHWDSEPCQVTWVGKNTAVVIAVDSEKHLALLGRVTIDPADVKLSRSQRANQTIAERAAAARGRNRGLKSPLRRPGKGATEPAARAEANGEARKAVER